MPFSHFLLLISIRLPLNGIIMLISQSFYNIYNIHIYACWQRLVLCARGTTEIKYCYQMLKEQMHHSPVLRKMCFDNSTAVKQRPSEGTEKSATAAFFFSKMFASDATLSFFFASRSMVPVKPFIMPRKKRSAFIS